MRSATGPTDRVVVVGAGLGGLACALHLAGAGRQVTVVERESIPGGRAGRLALGGYEFTAGEKYAEFKSGDKIAEYGLGALVLGGAAAAAAKAGWLKFLGKFWIVIVAALAAAWGFIKRFFFGRKDATPPGPGAQ